MMSVALPLSLDPSTAKNFRFPCLLLSKSSVERSPATSVSCSQATQAEASPNRIVGNSALLPASSRDRASCAPRLSCLSSS